MIHLKKLILILLVISSSKTIFADFLKFKQKKIQLDQITLNVQIANTASKRSMGLMFQEPLESNEGMLFIYQTIDFHNIWMPNMKFSIDVIWFDKNKKVIYFKENIPPCTKNKKCAIYSSPKKSLYLLEVKAGFVKKKKNHAKNSSIFC